MIICDIFKFIYVYYLFLISLIYTHINIIKKYELNFLFLYSKNNISNDKIFNIINFKILKKNLLGNDYVFSITYFFFFFL